MKAALMRLTALGMLLSAADMLLPACGGKSGVRLIGALMTAAVMLELAEAAGGLLAP